MQAEYRKSKSERNGTIVRALHSLWPGGWYNPRFDPVFTDGITFRYLAGNWKAYWKFRNFDPDKTTKVGIFSLPRGGSHVFSTQFHYPNGGFCFSEGFPLTDRRSLGFRSFLLRSTFAVNGLQEKNPRDITHLFYNLNSTNHLDRPEWSPTTDASSPRYWIIYLRNPFRILLSMDRSGKSKWKLTEELVRTVCTNYNSLVSFYLQWQVVFPESFCVLLHEQFIQEPTATIQSVSKLVGLSLDSGQTSSPLSFFKKCFRCGSTPEIRSGKLVSPVSGEQILGWGGGFNPCTPIDVKRALKPDLETTFPPSFKDLVFKLIGDDKAALWFEDRSHRYSDAAVKKLLPAAAHQIP